jgi:hypothetical protein
LAVKKFKCDPRGSQMNVLSASVKLGKFRVTTAYPVFH